MKRCLLFLLLIACGGGSELRRGAAVTTPATARPAHTPQGAGLPGERSPDGRGVARNDDPRILPPDAAPTVYGASKGRRTGQKVVELKPDGIGEDTWEECKKEVAAAVAHTQWAAPQQQAMATMTDAHWKCARERALFACVLSKEAPTPDAMGLLTARARLEEFTDAMGRRLVLACTGLPPEVDAFTNALNAAVMFRVLSHASTTELVEALRHHYAPTLAKGAKVSPERARAKPTTTPVGIPQKAWDRCWSEVQACLNEELELRTADDDDFECMRYVTLGACGGVANMNASSFSPYREAMHKAWGEEWDTDAFYDAQHKNQQKACAKTAFRPAFNAMYERIQKRCGQRWSDALVPKKK